ncbi:hypothetical protein Nepgr_023346 [Nepenthes gracilis]|uniref:Uncharacterized protein n=1 Tax=Nepenthes gracilis TaxID=150966 RepID=A0AAD3T2N5_NEPGR|nr:hypothetical protein Nepgr_023346 [Nepenthes gracilis]
MGGGNGQKSKMARERNMEKNKVTRGSQIESNKKAMSIQCKVCMQTFICTTSEAKCREHAEAKHPNVVKDTELICLYFCRASALRCSDIM